MKAIILLLVVAAFGAAQEFCEFHRTGNTMAQLCNGTVGVRGMPGTVGVSPPKCVEKEEKPVRHKDSAMDWIVSGAWEVVKFPFQLLYEGMVRAVMLVLNQAINTAISMAMMAAVAYYMRGKKQLSTPSVFDGVGHTLS